MKLDAATRTVAGRSDVAESDYAYVLDLFTRLIALGTFYHASKLLRRLHTAGLSLTTYSDFYAWTPGLFPPAPVNLIVNWVAFAIAAVVVALRPSPWSISVWALLSVSHFFVIPQRLPNHYLVLVLAALILAISSVAVRLTAKAPGQGLSTAAVMLRHLAILTYAFAFLHKLNRSYLDWSSSPIEGLLAPILGALGSPRASAVVAAAMPALAVSSLAIEAAMPVLLVYAPLRRLGFVLGGCFHALTTLGGALDYSMIMLAFYVLFLPNEGRAWVRRFLHPSPRGFAVQACITLLLFRCSYLFEEAGRWRSPAFLPESVLVLALLLVIVRVVAVALFEWPRELETRAPLSAHPVQRATVALALVVSFDLAYVVNCMGPYLGLKSEWSQAMFSGLTWRGDNHLFLPQIVAADPYVYDLRVEPRTRIAPELVARRAGLKPIAGGARRMERNLFFNLLRNLCREPGLRPIAVSFRSADVEHQVADVCATTIPTHPFNLYPW